MSIAKGVAAAALLALSIVPAAACDDFDDEKALTAAVEAAKVARAPDAAAAVASAPPAPAAAAAEPARAPTLTAETGAGTVSR